MNGYDCIVIGGGAAGLMAAVTASELGRSVLLLERNDKLGKKLAITGKGRCNVTNNCGLEELMENIPVNGRFLYSAFSQFMPEDTMEFFETRGVPLKTERGKRVFPVSDKAEDIVNVFVDAVKQNGITIKKVRVTELIIENDRIQGVKCGDGRFYAESVLIATGGKSYPLTGSDGDGYTLAKQAGHNIIPPKASLVPIVSEEDYCAEMMGLSLKNVVLTLKDKSNGETLYSELGEMLFTHFGISGPLALSASSHIRKMQQNRYTIEIDLKPALSEEKLDLRLQRDFLEMKNRDFANALNKLLPTKMIPIAVKLSGITPETKINSVTREQRHAFVKLLKAFPITVKAFRPVEEAIVTSGGVAVKEISPKTMESKLVKGLYFAGEVIDVDAYTGGFNLQIAFATGRCAGNNM